MRLKGKRTARRTNKRSHFDHRKKKSMTAEKMTLLNSKSDKIDTEHNPDESFNYADDEESNTNFIAIDNELNAN